MFNYSLRTKIILIVVAIALVVAIVFLSNQQKSRGFDLYKVSQMKSLASGLELYFDKNHEYPQVDKIAFENIAFITENGINQPGNFIYYRSSAKTIAATLLSTPERYIIEFPLENAWPLWGIDSRDGGSCRISNYLEMICRSSD